VNVERRKEWVLLMVSTIYQYGMEKRRKIELHRLKGREEVE